jgi:hypothetical protein
MNKREKIFTSMVLVCIIVASTSLVRCYSLTNDYNHALETTNNFMSVLELERSTIPKIYVGEKYLFGEAFNFSNWSHYPKQTTYLERYSSHLKEVIAIMKSQVHLLGEDPELFEQCLYSIYDFQKSANLSDGHCIPYVAWKGKYIDCPIAFHDPGEPSKYDNVDVWAIMILFNDRYGIETTYYVDTGTLKGLPFYLGTD